MSEPGENIFMIIDFMSRVRTIFTQNCKTFGDLISLALVPICHKFNAPIAHIILDSYLECSIKSCERLTRSEGIEPIKYEEGDITPDLLLPNEMNRFWAHYPNKVQLENCVTTQVAENYLLNIDVVVSGRVYDDDMTPAQFFKAGRDPKLPYSQPIDILKSGIDEADDRVIPHCAYEVNRGAQRILVISNDTDTVVCLLYHMNFFKQNGLIELWCQYGRGENKRYLPIHKMFDSLGYAMCKAVLKAHVLTGNDCLSKIGTKHAALNCDPVKFLSSFGESENLCDAEICLAEEYLVNVWTGVRVKVTTCNFNGLRLSEYTSAKNAKPIESLPPTSSVISYHIKIAHYVVRNALNLLSDHDIVDPTLKGWIRENGVMVPDMNLKPLPSDITVKCKCEGRCVTKKCPCKSVGQPCTLFCHKKNSSPCINI